MSDDPGFDVARAHRWFAATCFNAAWNFIDKPERTPDEDERMLALAHASLWHWTQRDDCTARNLSIGHWQLSRVHALAGEVENARKHARRCLAVTPEEDAFCLGYGHEAAARAEALAGNATAADEHLTAARELLESVTEEGERAMLAADLDTIATGV
jgi:hypothetical protein